MCNTGKGCDAKWLRFWTEFKAHLFLVYLFDWNREQMKERRKPKFPGKPPQQDGLENATFWSHNIQVFEGETDLHSCIGVS